jgi:hypothetical protein
VHEKSRRTVWTIVSLSLVLGVKVQGGEIGHYAGGLVNIRDVIMPPAPGVYAAVYNYYYTTDQLNNANGDKISSVNINPGPGRRNGELARGCGHRRYRAASDVGSASQDIWRPLRRLYCALIR